MGDEDRVDAEENAEEQIVRRGGIRFGRPFIRPRARYADVGHGGTTEEGTMAGEAEWMRRRMREVDW